MAEPKNLELRPVESFGEILAKAATEAYAEIAHYYSSDFGSDPNGIYYKDACQQFYEKMYTILKAKGITSKHRKIDIRSIRPRGKHHIILETENFLVDGTWQQFVDGPPDPAHPCLILNKKSLKEDLERASVPKGLWFLYGVPAVTGKAAWV